MENNTNDMDIVSCLEGTGEEQRKCGVCNAELPDCRCCCSADNTRLSKKRAGTRERTYSCHLCIARFVENDLLKEHIRTHTRDCPVSVIDTSPTESATHSSNCHCAIENVLRRGFISRAYSEKKSIIEKGRPLDKLEELRTQTKRSVRTFNFVQYSRTDWLCGCGAIGRLFCWPCLLFSDCESVWNSIGFCDMNNFHNALKRHENSQSHIVSAIKLATFDSRKVKSQPQLLQHNEKVKENREILKRFIDIICHLGKRILAFRGHSESESPIGGGNCVEIVDLLRKYDNTLNLHQKNSILLSTGLSNKIQNHLIESISNVIIEEVKREVRNVPFVSIMVDETTDLQSQSLLSFVLRYVSSDGEIMERFIGFSDVGADRTAVALANRVIDIIVEYDFGKKIVAQTYDGAAVMSGELYKLQAKVRRKFPGAIFIHCLAPHKLNLVLSQSLSDIKECKVFFKDLNSFPAFFAKSSKITDYFDKVAGRKFPEMKTGWDYNICLVETVHRLKSELIAMFENIIENPDDWDSETYVASRGFLYVLKDFTFSFLLTTFKSLFSVTRIHFEILQTEFNNMSVCVQNVTKTKDRVTKIRGNVENIYSKILSDEETKEPQSKHPRLDNVEVKRYFEILYNEIVDIFVNQIEQRFQNLEKFTFFELINDCSDYEKAFPQSAFSSLKSAYGQHFNLPHLYSELNVYYSDEKLRKKSAHELLLHLKATNVDVALCELTKLCKLILTIPTTSASVENSISTLTRIKTFVRDSQEEDRMSRLSVISIEKKLLETTRNHEDFYDRVFKNFAAKDGTIDLVFTK